MAPERWRQVEAICQSALKAEPTERSAYLDSACGADQELRREVESLLGWADKADDFLEVPAAALVEPNAFPGGTALNLAGCSLLHYRIVEKVGEGGMGAVYRAHDERLRRTVALKVLPSEYAGDPERRRRLLREAQAASALSHPNIVAIHEVGSDSGVDFIAMEFVEGKTLRTLIPKKGLPLPKTLDYAVQIAGGLAKAHAVGVIHRDLKPGNIMVTADGLVKVLDFGLARRVSPEPRQETTLTAEGDIAGTPAYMSPEQAEGKPLDTRSDIFSFGALLYQMLTGRLPFPGSSTASTLAAILHEDAPPLGPGFPRELERIMTRCLRKDSAHRFQHIDDVKVELEDLQAETAAGKLDSDPPRGIRRPRQWRRVAVTVLAIVVAFLIGGWLFSAGPAIDVTKHRYSPIALESPPRFGPIYTGGGGNGAFQPAWSPDGTRIAYKADHIRFQSTDGVKSQLLVPEKLQVPEEGEHPFFSSDGLQVYYFISGQTSRELWSASLAGGAPQPVLYDLGGFGPLLGGAAESRDGGALAVVRPVKEGSDEMSVWVSKPPGAPPFPYPGSPTGRNLNRAFLRFSPDGSKLLLTLAPHGGPVQWWLLRWPPPRAVQPNAVRRLFENGPRGAHGSNGDWLSDNRHLIATIHQEGYQGGPLWVADTVTGTWRRITPGSFLCNSPKVSRDRRVLFHKDLGPEAGVRRFVSPVFSPDGTRIAYSSGAGIWVSPVAGGQATYICDGYCPTWSDDGTSLAFVNNPRATTTVLMKVNVSHRKNPVTICSSPHRWIPRWSPDGKWITAQLPGGFGVISPDGARSKVLYRGTLDWASACGWSRDGSTLYVAHLSGERDRPPDFRRGESRVLSSFDVATGTERLIRDLGRVHFSYFVYHSAALSLSPDGKSLAASTLDLRSESWILDGLEPPRPLWTRLFRR